MKKIIAYADFVAEGRVPRSERVELYKDDNIIVVVPLTHRALQKYAHKCQWCINDDLGEWEDYHKGKHAVIIQRNPKKDKIGITGHPIPAEIFLLAKWDNNQSSFEDVCQMLEYEFRNDRTMSDYYVKISNDIDNFATNIVYYSPENGIYDMEDNFLWNFNYEISDIPNVTPEVIKIMDEYLTKEDSVMESMDSEMSIYDHLNVELFDKLPYEYQKSLVIWREEGIGNDDSAIEDIIGGLTKVQKRKSYYYGVVPTDLIKEEVGKRMGYGTFDEFYNIFWSTDDTEHGDSVLPIIIDFDDEELIVDGWHRFSSYCKKGIREIPVLGIYRD